MVTERNVIKKEADAEKENGRLEVTFETSGRSKKAIIGVLSALGALLAIVIVVKIYLFFKTEWRRVKELWEVYQSKTRLNGPYALLIMSFNKTFVLYAVETE